MVCCLRLQVGFRGGEAHKRTWDFVFNRTADLVRRYGSGPDAVSSASYSLGRTLKVGACCGRGGAAVGGVLRVHSVRKGGCALPVGRHVRARLVPRQHTCVCVCTGPWPRPSPPGRTHGLCCQQAPEPLAPKMYPTPHPGRLQTSHAWIAPPPFPLLPPRAFTF